MTLCSVSGRKALLILLVAFVFSCAGCAARQGESAAPLTVASSAEGAPSSTVVSDDAFEDYDDDGVSDISDPLEGWNRFWFKFNDVMLLHVIKPVYTGYTAVTPQPLRTGLSNAFHNLQTPVRLVNCVLQGRFGEAWVEFGRFIVNTTAGFGGVFDVAGAARRDSVGDHEMLLSESQARAFVAVPEVAVKAVFAAAEAEGVDAIRIGTTGGDMLAISGVDLLAAEGEGCGWIASIDELRELSDTGRKYF